MQLGKTIQVENVVDVELDETRATAKVVEPVTVESRETVDA